MRHEKHTIGELTVDWCSLRAMDLGIGDRWYADVTNGSNGNSGKTARSALKTIAAAESAMVAAQNDSLLLMPGAYPVTSEIAWDKDATRIYGLGGPNQMGDYSCGNVTIYTETAGVGYPVNLTGNNCIFADLTFGNVADDATNLAAFRLNAYGAAFDHVGFIGTMATDQLASADCSSIAIHTNGHFPLFNNCFFGEDCWGARSGARGGVLNFTGSQPNGGILRDCFIKSASNTATVAMVRVIPIGIGRSWLFERCTFNNWGTSDLNQAFASTVNDTTHSWTQISLKDCAHFGITKWTANTVSLIYGNMPIADDAGGNSISVDS